VGTPAADRDEQIRRIEPASVDGITCSLTLHCLPPAATVDAFAEAGFMVDRVVEPQPSPEALSRFPDELGEFVGIPGFIVYRLRPIAN